VTRSRGSGARPGVPIELDVGRRPRLRHGLTALAVGAVCAALGACGEGGSGGGAATGPVTVSLTVPNLKLNFSQEVSAGFAFGASGVPGVASQVRGPDIVDGAAQLRMFEELTAESGAGTAVYTLNPEVFAGARAAAADRGIPLVAVDNPPSADSGVTLFVGNDNADLGRRLAEQVVAQLPAGTRDGTVVIGTTSPGAVVLEQRVSGLQESFRELIPGVTVLGPFDTKQEVESNRAAW
jgi:ribose transport system substrate-binding protein